MPVPNKHTPPHQTHTLFKKRTGQAVAIGCWARPEKDTAWQPTYLQPSLFIPNFSPFSPLKCSSLTHLDDSFPFRSSPWTSPFSWAHSLFTLSFHQPWDSPWSRSLPYCFAGLQNVGPLFPLPHCRPYTKGASGHNLALLYSQSVTQKILVLTRVKPNFSSMRHTERSMLPQHISSVYF